MPRVTKRPGRKHYYAWVEGRYVSTGHTDQRLAVQAAARMQTIGVVAYRQGKRSLSERLADLVEEHLDHLRDHDGRGPEHLRKKRTQLMRPIEAGVFRMLRDVRKQPYESWLNSLECGPKTRNEYLTAWNVFLDWLVYEDRLDENPFRGRIRRARVNAEHRDQRRALTLDELRALLAVAAHRELLYLTAATTGARFNELRQLRWDDVHEHDEAPSIHLRPETTKNRKGRVQYITAELAAAFAEARTPPRTTRCSRQCRAITRSRRISTPRGSRSELMKASPASTVSGTRSPRSSHARPETPDWLSAWPITPTSRPLSDISTPSGANTRR